MTVTAYIQGSPEFPHPLTVDSTITIKGVTYPIPEYGWYGPDRKPSRAAPHRIAAALEEAGYDPRYSDLTAPDAHGVFQVETRVVKA